MTISESISSRVGWRLSCVRKTSLLVCIHDWKRPVNNNTNKSNRYWLWLKLLRLARKSLPFDIREELIFWMTSAAPDRWWNEIKKNEKTKKSRPGWGGTIANKCTFSNKYHLNLNSNEWSEWAIRKHNFHCIVYLISRLIYNSNVDGYYNTIW